MNIYHYHPTTKEFLGSSVARQDPLTPGAFLIPANATSVAPPSVPSGKVAVFSNGQWALVSDFRGQVWNTTTGEESELTAIGDLPAGFTTIPRPGENYTWDSQAEDWILDLDKAKEDIWKSIRDERDHRTQINGFKVEVSTDVFKWFHSDVFSRGQQSDLYAAGEDCPATPWKTMDGSFVLMSPVIARKILEAKGATDISIFAAAEQHKAAAHALEDPTTYTAYLDDANWPERYHV